MENTIIFGNLTIAYPGVNKDHIAVILTENQSGLTATEHTSPW
ncbi:hypothetical protein B6N60_03371 [Richelia sinica FACHB-800]|uniref:Uncharacterized protein n=1 Tax=Richelia sinica FACHB-800 TaxID=1357546 RepID=A0A975T9N7_9NOST|nr:hypothetical protein [Richelia sinica]QXE24664.1 hypothetical protein B6N60_03371 [Richelia sinica FACHB-800]